MTWCTQMYNATAALNEHLIQICNAVSTVLNVDTLKWLKESTHQQIAVHIGIFAVWIALFTGTWLGRALFAFDVRLLTRRQWRREALQDYAWLFVLYGIVEGVIVSVPYLSSTCNNVLYYPLSHLLNYNVAHAICILGIWVCITHLIVWGILTRHATVLHLPSNETSVTLKERGEARGIARSLLDSMRNTSIPTETSVGSAAKVRARPINRYPRSTHFAFNKVQTRSQSNEDTMQSRPISYARVPSCNLHTNLHPIFSPPFPALTDREHAELLRHFLQILDNRVPISLVDKHDTHSSSDSTTERMHGAGFAQAALYRATRHDIVAELDRLDASANVTSESNEHLDVSYTKPVLTE